MRRKNRHSRHLYNVYDLALKKKVVIYAERNGNKEAQAHYGISEANIRRWRRLKQDLFSRTPDNNSRTRILPKQENAQQDFSIIDNPEDAMPLQERLSKVVAQEKIAASAAGGGASSQGLKSQSLSPTKLKVSRHSGKAAPPKAVEQPPQSPVNEEMCLRWNSHHSNMQTAFPNILSKEQYVDVTLAAEGKTLKCHRLILSSCSPYFEEILSGISPFQHPVLFMRDIPFWILKSLCDFMYAGEVHICQDRLEELLTVAEVLKIKGLAGKSTPPDKQEEQQQAKADNKEAKKINNKPPEKEKDRPTVNANKKPFFTRSSYESGISHDYDDDMLDPLELLEPLYEEVAEEKKPSTSTSTSSTVVKPKEFQQFQPIKKPFGRRLRKRKYSEQREPSPPQVFSFRKGTRSRPHVKVPKYYPSDFSNTKPGQNFQTDPLLDVEEIKTEPIDVEDNNLVEYSDDEHQYMENSIEPNNCDSPVVITSSKAQPQQPRTASGKFKKIRLSKPIITDVHSINESGSTTSGGLEVIKITLQQQPEDEALETHSVDDNEEPIMTRSITITQSEIGGSSDTTVTHIAIDPEDINEAETSSQETETNEVLVVGTNESGGDPLVDALEPGEATVADGEATEEEAGEAAEKEGGGEALEPVSCTDGAVNSVGGIRIGDVRTASEGEAADQETEEEEERRTTSLDHLEKEAMNVVNAINKENQHGPVDVE